MRVEDCIFQRRKEGRWLGGGVEWSGNFGFVSVHMYERMRTYHVVSDSRLSLSGVFV